MDQNPDNPDEYNVYSDPSWQPLFHLAAEQTCCMPRPGMRFANSPKEGFHSPFGRAECRKETEPNGTIHRYNTLNLAGRTYRSHQMRERDVDTTWTVEHFFKDAEDLAHWLDHTGEDDWEPVADISHLLETEEKLGDAGIIMVDMGDPLCDLAGLFSMEDYLVTALQNRELFHKALGRIAGSKQKEVEALAKAAPGRLWRICGPEYATAPFLPPALFDEYVVRYDAPMIDAIKQTGGVPRAHIHGNLRGILPLVLKAGWTATDPAEPPSQGDMEVEEIRAVCGENFTIFGNVEVSWIETMEESLFREKIKNALKNGPNSKGTCFVLQPGACPIGRNISPRVLHNYTTMVEECSASRR
jgi:uroporphyrinogen-III decarboxylase